MSIKCHKNAQCNETSRSYKTGLGCHFSPAHSLGGNSRCSCSRFLFPVYILYNRQIQRKWDTKWKVRTNDIEGLWGDSALRNKQKCVTYDFKTPLLNLYHRSSQNTNLEIFHPFLEKIPFCHRNFSLTVDRLSSDFTIISEAVLGGCSETADI